MPRGSCEQEQRQHRDNTRSRQIAEPPDSMPGFSLSQRTQASQQLYQAVGGGGGSAPPVAIAMSWSAGLPPKKKLSNREVQQLAARCFNQDGVHLCPECGPQAECAGPLPHETPTRVITDRWLWTTLRAASACLPPAIHDPTRCDRIGGD